MTSCILLLPFLYVPIDFEKLKLGWWFDIELDPMCVTDSKMQVISKVFGHKRDENNHLTTFFKPLANICDSFYALSHNHDFS
jgi:hypothetical protein